MKIILYIEHKVNSAPKGYKMSTFRYLILENANIFLANNIKSNDFMSITSSLTKGYRTEYDKQINFYKYLRRNGLTIPTSDLCNKMIELSYETWERIKFIRKSILPLKVHEVTLTENILYELNVFLKTCHNRRIEIFEAVNEQCNGNDIEFFIEQADGEYIFFPMQAKILYPSLKYEQIPYKNQTELLLKYAKKKKGIPLYLLYNFVPKYNSTLNHFGCSIVDANYIKSNFSLKNPTFDDLHVNLIKGKVVASPWYTLICEQDGLATSGEITKEYKLYSEDEIIDDESWFAVPLFLNSTQENKENIFSIEQKNFSPKYRIILGGKNETSMESL